MQRDVGSWNGVGDWTERTSSRPTGQGAAVAARRLGAAQTLHADKFADVIMGPDFFISKLLNVAPIIRRIAFIESIMSVQ